MRIVRGLARILTVGGGARAAVGQLGPRPAGRRAACAAETREAAAFLRLLSGRLGSNHAGASSERLLHATRVPRSADEERVERVLALLRRPTRDALVAKLADDLRRLGDDPFLGADELGPWRLSLYQHAAEELVSGLLGDFLVEGPSAPGRRHDDERAATRRMDMQEEDACVEV